MVPDFCGADDLSRIHNASMQIIEANGFPIHCEDTLATIKGCGVKVEGNRAFFTGQQVMEWVAKAPSEFTVYARNPRWNMTIGGDYVNCAPAFGSAFIKEVDGTLRDACMADYIKLVKLFHQCDSFKMNGGILVQPSDVDASCAMSVELLTTALYSDKCFLSGAGGREESENQMELLKILFSESSLKEKTRVVAVMNVNSPMQFDKSQLETLTVFAENGQAVGINGGVSAGNSGPITLAGSIALGNAEVLVGVAISQMICEGAKVLYGLPAAQAVDMKTGGTAIGGPETSLGTRYGARLAKAYGLPCRSCGSPTDAKSVYGAQNGYEAAFLMFNNFEAKSNLIVHAAGVMDSYMSTSLEKCIIDFEIIRMCERYARGIDLTEKGFSLDVINRVGAGGLFLTDPHTFQNCRNEHFTPDLGFRGADLPDAEAVFQKRVGEKLEKMLAEYTQPDVDRDVIDAMRAFLVSKGYTVPELV